MPSEVGAWIDDPCAVGIIRPSCFDGDPIVKFGFAYFDIRVLPPSSVFRQSRVSRRVSPVMDGRQSWVQEEEVDEIP